MGAGPGHPIIGVTVTKSSTLYRLTLNGRSGDADGAKVGSLAAFRVSGPKRDQFPPVQLIGVCLRYPWARNSRLASPYNL